MTERVVNLRVKQPIECPIARIQTGWIDGKPVFADVYPSDLIVQRFATHPIVKP